MPRLYIYVRDAAYMYRCRCSRVYVFSLSRACVVSTLEARRRRASNDVPVGHFWRVAVSMGAFLFIKCAFWGCKSGITYCSIVCNFDFCGFSSNRVFFSQIGAVFGEKCGAVLALWRR